MIYSGRTQTSVFDASRLIGARSYIFELGCGLVLDGELEWLTDGLVPNAEAGSIYDQIEDSGAPALLLGRYAGRLEPHTPWAATREVSHLYRGDIPLAEVATTLEQAGLASLRLVDNGVIHEARALGLMPQLERVRVYHLIPATSSKARAVARHMQARGYAPADCIAAGDSREDIQAAEVVGSFWLMANALEHDPALADEVKGHPRVRIASERYGAGVYEAVVTTLAERRG